MPTKKKPVRLAKVVELKPTKKPKKGWSQGCRARYRTYARKMAVKDVTVIGFEKWAQINC